MDTEPEFLTSPEAALAHVAEMEDALLAAGDRALAAFLDRVVTDAEDGQITRGAIMGYWLTEFGKALSHPAFSDIRDDMLGSLDSSGFADDVYSAAEMALEIAHNFDATSNERSALLNTLFAHPTPGLIASLSDRVNRWLTRRVQRYLRMRLAELGPDDLERDDLVGNLYEIPEGPPVANPNQTRVLVHEEDWSEDDRPGDINWRSRMQRDIRTSYTAVFGKNMLRVIEKYGYYEKRWVSRKDDRVRHAHLIADGQTVPIYEPFIVGGFPLQFPGDPLGPPGQTINCRCTIVASGVRQT